jgi:hypothetical protein
MVEKAKFNSVKTERQCFLVFDEKSQHLFSSPCLTRSNLSVIWVEGAIMPWNETGLGLGLGLVGLGLVGLGLGLGLGLG